MAQKSKVSIAVVSVLIVILGVAMFSFLSYLNPTRGVTTNPNEPGSLRELVEFGTYTAELQDLTDLTDPERVDFINNILADDGYKNVSDALGQKGFQFDTEQAAVSSVNSLNLGGFAGHVMSMWSTDTGPNGTRAFISAAMINGFSLVVGGITNLLPPDQIPEIDPYIIVNAMPYMYISLYWWVWAPVARLHTWHYWWYDSHSHPNWYWGVYWWWRTDLDYYWLAPGHGLWQPWWWWFWHWTYWRHWYWWSTGFEYV
ncbi:MAG: hypothetical protein OEZ35_02145 [Candidatus Bathyarchaeota archaeon]|nr:hypothetical protein [Candidatus Bathyarchaeota archaeon]